MVRLRRHLLSLACLLIAAGIGVVAVLDHRDKQLRMNRAELAHWYCLHRGARCGGASSQAIERHWNERQWGYEIAVTALAGAALLRAASREVSEKGRRSEGRRFRSREGPPS